MEEKQKIPNIRFNGFVDQWKNIPLNEIADVGTGYPFNSNLFSSKGRYLVITNSNIQDESQSVNSIVGNRIDLINSIFKNHILDEGEILVTMDGTVGRSAMVLSLNLILAQRVARLTSKTSNYFLYYLLNTGEFSTAMTKLSKGGTIKHISLSDISKHISYIPKENEQTQIGNFFKTLDEQINLQEQKHQKLVNLKKAMLEKMFPKEGADTPEIRFKGFTEKWEEKKLGDVFAKIRNAFVGTATPFYVNKGHFYLESNNIKDGFINRKTEVFINDYFYLKQKDKWLQTGDIVMVQSGHVGHSAVITEELNNSAAHALIMFSKPINPVHTIFINYQFTTLTSKNKIDTITTGNTIKHILSSDMKDFVIKLPTLDEQQKIGDYFENLDQLIQQAQLQLEKHKNIKQALLQKMFV